MKFYSIFDNGKSKYVDETLENVDKLVKVMFSEFNRKKKAFDIANRKTHQMGSVDTSKLWKYRTSDNIFKSKTVVHEKKSHGVFVIMDFSGSMTSVVDSVMLQALILALFCKRCNIPFEICSFTSGSDRTVAQDISGGMYSSINKFFSSDMSVEKIKKIFALFHLHWCGIADDKLVSEFGISANQLKSFRTMLRMSGTPLYDTYAALFTKIVNMKKSNNIQNMNLVSITDGESERFDASVVIDPFTNREYKFTGYATFNQMFRAHGVKHHEFYIGEGRDKAGWSAIFGVKDSIRLEPNFHLATSNKYGYASVFLVAPGLIKSSIVVKSIIEEFTKNFK